MNTYFHASPVEINGIRGDGLFGGLFATSSRDAAMSHGHFLYAIESPRALSDYVLNYELDGAFEIALDLAGGDESVADAIMAKSCESDDAERGWEFQRLRGVLASRLGYTSVEMLDEHGTTWLCLPGCVIRIAHEGDE